MGNSAIQLSGITPTLNYSSRTTTPYSVQITDAIVEWGGASQGTFNLYTASGNAGRTLQIKNITTQFNLLISANTSETIDGFPSITLRPSESVTLYCDGLGWDITPNTKASVTSGHEAFMPAYNCRAWVNFDGTTSANVSGTYTQSGTTVTVNIAGHNQLVGHVVQTTINGGTAVGGTYTVTSATANTFTYTAGSSLATSGNIILNRGLIRAAGNISNVTYISVGNYAVNFTTPMPDANYTFLGSLNTDGQTFVWSLCEANIPRTTTTIRLTPRAYGTAHGALNNTQVNVAFFR